MNSRIAFDLRVQEDVMQAVRWFFISLPFVGLAWLIAEIITRDRHALLEMARDSEAFARAPAPSAKLEKHVRLSSTSLKSGIEVHG